MQQFELTNEFLAKLEEIINANDKEGASKIVETLHPPISPKS